MLALTRVRAAAHPMSATAALQAIMSKDERSRDISNATERACFQLTFGSSCEHMLESKKATESVAREKTHMRGTRAVSQLVFLLHVGALVSALPLSAPRKSGV